MCRCWRAERTDNAISGTKPPFTTACTALCLGALRQGRSAKWRCGASLCPLEDPVPCPIFGARILLRPGLLMEPFGYTPAAMPVGSAFEHGPCPPTASSLAIPQCGPCHFTSARSDFEYTLSLVGRPIIPTSSPIQAWSRHSLQIFTVSFCKRTWAQCILLHPLHLLHHQNPELDRPAARFWLTSRHLVVYPSDARTLFHPHVLSLPMIIVWELRRLVKTWPLASNRLPYY